MQTVTQDSTTITVTSSALQAVFSQEVDLTATISPDLPGSGVPRGLVTFMDAGTSLGTSGLDSYGSGMLPISTLSIAGSPHAITAIYTGDANLLGSTSASLTTNNHAGRHHYRACCRQPILPARVKR